MKFRVSKACASKACAGQRRTGALRGLLCGSLMALAALAGCSAVADARGVAIDPIDPIDPDASIAHPAPALPSRTEQLAAACNGCHGPGGTGSGAMPALAGSDAQELADTLERWRLRSEPNARDHVMVRFARSLTADDVEALARHYAALPGTDAGAAAASNAVTGPTRGAFTSTRGATGAVPGKARP